MATREGLSFESAIESDCAPLWEPVKALLDAGIEIHCLRDLTRGGLSSGADRDCGGQPAPAPASRNPVVPVREEVAGACEILGLDPLYLANEGRFAAFVPPQDADRALEIFAILRSATARCASAEMLEEPAGLVTMKTQRRDRTRHRHVEWRTVAENLLTSFSRHALT